MKANGLGCEERAHRAVKLGGRSGDFKDSIHFLNIFTGFDDFLRTFFKKILIQLLRATRRVLPENNPVK